MDRISIVRGTTPTITYTFSVVSPADLTSAILTIEHRGRLLVAKGLSDATAGETTLSWTLTQQETLALPGMDYRMSIREPAHIMVNWLAQDGTRGASSRREVMVGINDYGEVMS